MIFGSSTFIGQVDDPVLKPRGRCGKARYGSYGAARRSIRAMQRSGKDRPYEGYLHPYVCEECRVYHVGHTAYEED